MYSPHNPYDQPQWAMVYLLQGSFMVVMVLLLVANLTTRFRIMVVSLSCYLSLNLGKKLGDRESSNLLLTLTFANRSDRSTRWAKRVRGPPFSRTVSLRVSRSSGTVLENLCRTRKPLRSNPHVFSRRFPILHAVVKGPYGPLQQDPARTRLGRDIALLALCWRPDLGYDSHPLTRSQKSPQPPVASMAG